MCKDQIKIGLFRLQSELCPHSVGMQVDKSHCLRRMRHFQFPRGKRQDVGVLGEQRGEAPEIMLYPHQQQNNQLTHWLTVSE